MKHRLRHSKLLFVAALVALTGAATLYSPFALAKHHKHAAAAHHGRNAAHAPNNQPDKAPAPAAAPAHVTAPPRHAAHESGPPITLQVESVGFGELRIDGQPQADPKAPISLARGHHVLEWERSLHTTERLEVQLPMQPTHTSEVVRMGATPQWGMLDVSSTPPGAQVTLNQKILGLTPLHVQYVQPGVMQLVVGGNGTYPAARPTRVTAGQTTREEYLLRTKDVAISVRLLDADGADVRGAAVYLDGEWLGATPLSAKMMPGAHKLSAETPAGGTVEQTLKIDGGDAQEIVLRVPK